MKKLFPFVCVVSWLIAAHAFAQNALSDSSPRLTFAERVSYQRAIEQVYWRHRIWPKENLSPKPPLDAVMSQAQLENKVTEYLRNSQALENDREKPITPQQLQVEMERMAQQTRQPEVLRELFAALGNDPVVIAECLARPVLLARLQFATVEQSKEPLESWSAKAQDQMPNVMVVANASYTLPAISDQPSDCDDGWTPTRTPTGFRRGRERHSAVWTGTEMIVWGGFFQGEQGRVIEVNTGGRYNPSTDSWAPTSTLNAPTARSNHTAVWTGTEMIVWGVDSGGGRYDPSTDTWTPTSTTNEPDLRGGHTAVWAGSEMVVWGGGYVAFQYFNTGGRYNPATDSWVATSTTNAPKARALHTAVWTGTEMIVWGGWDGHVIQSGGRYSPSTDSWVATSTNKVPTARYQHTAVWTGSEMIVWGGWDTESLFQSGGRYNPSTNSWVATSTTDAPSAREYPTAVWTGTEMIVWGGWDGHVIQSGGRYSPSTDSWTATSITNAPNGRWFHTAVWTGTEMIVWGGVDDSYFEVNSGGRYCARTGPAIALSAAGRKVEGINTAHLTWSGATSRQIDVYRCVQQDDSGFDCNPVPIVTTANNGAYTDSTGDTGRASYKYRVCEAGTSTCSNPAEVPK